MIEEIEVRFTAGYPGEKRKERVITVKFDPLQLVRDGAIKLAKEHLIGQGLTHLDLHEMRAEFVADYPPGHVRKG